MSTTLIFGLGLGLVVVAALGLIALGRRPVATPTVRNTTPAPRPRPKSTDGGFFEAGPTELINRDKVQGAPVNPVSPTLNERPTGPQRVVKVTPPPLPVFSAPERPLDFHLAFELRTDLEVDSPRESACLKALLKDPEDPDIALQLSGLMQLRGDPRADAIIAQWARLSATTDEEFHHAAWAEADVMRRLADTLTETVDPRDPSLSLIWRQGFIQHAQINCGDGPLDDEHALSLFARLSRSPAAVLMTDLVIQLSDMDNAQQLESHTLPPGLRRLSILCGDREAWAKAQHSNTLMTLEWGPRTQHPPSRGYDGAQLLADCPPEAADVLAVDLRSAAIAARSHTGGRPAPCFQVAGERITELFRMGAPPAAQLDGLLGALTPIGCLPLAHLERTEPHYQTRPVEAAAHRVIATGARACLVQRLLDAGALLVTRDVALGPGRRGGFLAIFEEQALFVSPIDTSQRLNRRHPTLG